MDLVELHHVIVAAEGEGMCGAWWIRLLARGCRRRRCDAGAIHAVPAAVVMDVVVVGDVAARGERFAVAAGQRDAAVASMEMSQPVTRWPVLLPPSTAMPNSRDCERCSRATVTDRPPRMWHAVAPRRLRT